MGIGKEKTCGKRFFFTKKSLIMETLHEPNYNIINNETSLLDRVSLDNKKVENVEVVCRKVSVEKGPQGFDNMMLQGRTHHGVVLGRFVIRRHMGKGRWKWLTILIF